MTKWTITTCRGETWELPEPLAWQLDYGLGSPCDGFRVKILWTEGREDLPADALRMTVTRDGEVVFHGVVDEFCCQWEETGITAEIVGRGLQALLLDNQAEAADFGLATLEEILRNYVTPFGIRLAAPARLPGVAGFSVASGSSCWKVLYDFARYHAGVTPRFDRTGRLVLTPWAGEEAIPLEKTGAVTRWVRREKRYGVLSQVVVKDVSGWNRQVVENAPFLAQGGQCRRVILLPRKTGFQARRYNGTFQIRRSEAERTRGEVTVAAPFAAWPGDLVTFRDTGTWRVAESRVTLDGDGVTTTLTLCLPEAVL